MICFVETEANEFVGRDRQISGLFHKDYYASARDELGEEERNK